MTADNFPERDNTTAVLPLTEQESYLLNEAYKQGSLETRLYAKHRHFFDSLKVSGLMMIDEARVARLTPAGQKLVEARLLAISAPAPPAAEPAAEEPDDLTPAAPGRAIPMTQEESVLAFLESPTVYPWVLAAFEEAIHVCRDESWLLMHTTCILVGKLRNEKISDTLQGVALNETTIFPRIIDLKPGFHDDLHG